MHYNRCSAAFCLYRIAAQHDVRYGKGVGRGVLIILAACLGPGVLWAGNIGIGRWLVLFKRFLVSSSAVHWLIRGDE